MRRLSIIDLAHRGVVYSLVGLSAYGLYIGYVSHRARMERARELMARRDESAQLTKQEEMHEQALAQAAQNAIRSKSS